MFTPAREGSMLGKQPQLHHNREQALGGDARRGNAVDPAEYPQSRQQREGNKGKISPSISTTAEEWEVILGEALGCDPEVVRLASVSKYGVTLSLMPRNGRPRVDEPKVVDFGRVLKAPARRHIARDADDEEEEGYVEEYIPEGYDFCGERWAIVSRGKAGHAASSKISKKPGEGVGRPGGRGSRQWGGGNMEGSAHMKQGGLDQSQGQEEVEEEEQEDDQGPAGLHGDERVSVTEETEANEVEGSHLPVTSTNGSGGS
ncbi:unnamed protein product, partial [Discosporangium mesarthrocarpum]